MIKQITTEYLIKRNAVNASKLGAFLCYQSSRLGGVSKLGGKCLLYMLLLGNAYGQWTITNSWDYQRGTRIMVSNLVEACKERRLGYTVAAGDPMIPSAWTNCRITHDNLEDAKTHVAWIAQNWYLNTNELSGGTYESYWNVNSNWPYWTKSTICSNCLLPDNYFDYTPYRCLNGYGPFASTNEDTNNVTITGTEGWTNAYTAAGGTRFPTNTQTRWSTIDYGWHGLKKALNAMVHIVHFSNTSNDWVGVAGDNLWYDSSITVTSSWTLATNDAASSYMARSHSDADPTMYTLGTESDSGVDKFSASIYSLAGYAVKTWLANGRGYTNYEYDVQLYNWSKIITSADINYWDANGQPVSNEYIRCHETITIPQYTVSRVVTGIVAIGENIIPVWCRQPTNETVSRGFVSSYTKGIALFDTTNGFKYVSTPSNP